MENRKVHTYEAEEFSHEYAKLKGMLGEDLMEQLSLHEGYIAGGALTSLFTNNEVNDFDLYFRTQRQLEEFTMSCFDVCATYGEEGQFTSLEDDDAYPNKSIINMGATDKSVMFTAFGGHIIQIIAFDVFPEPTDIFDKFDFSINMGCFDFSNNTWVFDSQFLKSNAQRMLGFNQKTAFPLISMLRVGKYQARGYKISKKDMMKLGVSASSLRIESWDDAKKHLSGMYGTNVNDLFDDAGEFSLDGLFEVLERAENKYIEEISTTANKPTAVRDESVNWFNCIHNLRIALGADNIVTEAYGLINTDDFGILDNKKIFSYGKKIPVNWLYNHRISLYPSLEVARQVEQGCLRCGYGNQQPRSILKVKLDPECIPDLHATKQGRLVSAKLSYEIEDFIEEVEKDG